MTGFKNYFEVSHDNLAKIGGRVNQSLSQNRISNNPTQLHFDDIFGHNLRVVVPIQDSKKRQLQYDLLDQGYEPDFQTGMASITIKTQHGDKVRTERIGAILSKLSKTNPKMKDLLSFWEKSKISLSKPQVGGVSVVISRSPIDILRMSDHAEWTSCHSPEDSYWHCAIQEAKTGGAVAYVVLNSDLDHVQDLQAKDIFKDNDRSIEGIEPLERVRLRRFSDGKINLLVPEIMSYGIKHSEFVNTVLDWARHAQRHLVDPTDPPKLKDFNLHGGSYQDHATSEIWNKLFDANEPHKKKTSVDQSEKNEKDGENIEAQLEDAEIEIRQHGGNWHHYMAGADENEDYISIQGWTMFEFPVTDFIKDIGYRDVSIIGREFSKDYSYPGTRGDFNIDKSDDNIKFYVDFHNENGVEGLNTFLNEIDSADERYNEDRKALWEILIKFGFTRDWRGELEHIPFRNFSFEKYEHGDTWFESNCEWIGDLQGLDPLKFGINSRTVSKERSGFYLYKLEIEPEGVLHWVNSIFPDFVQKEHIDFFVSNPPSREAMADMTTFTYPIKVYIQFSFEVENPDQKLVEEVKMLDYHWNEYMKRVTQHWNECKPLMSPNRPTNWNSEKIIPKRFEPVNNAPLWHQQTLNLQEPDLTRKQSQDNDWPKNNERNSILNWPSPGTK